MPLADFSSHDPDFSAEQVAQCARIVDGLRAINSKIVRLSGPVEELAAAADRIESLSASLNAVTQRRAMETFRFRFDTGEPNSVMPFNPATGAFNPIAPKLEMRVENDKLVAEFAFASHYESSPDSVQGGMVAACFDQLLAFAVMAHGKTGPTVSLAVRFVKRTPISQPLRFESWVESVDGEKFSARGSCFLGDVKVSEAEALILGKYEMPVVGA
ncbi:MAG: PaaI family thioesterase [Proteobacteria bacterium]|nr:PaaI family thioesterase [Pseudomonadota bacterium]